MKDFNTRIVVFLSRIYIGGILLLAGSDKIFVDGVAGFVQYLQGGFGETFLPIFLVTALGYILPFAEFLVGLMLIVGLFRKVSFTGAGILFLLLSQGQFMIEEYATAARNGVYFLVTVFALAILSRPVLAFDSIFDTKV